MSALIASQRSKFATVISLAILMLMAFAAPARANGDPVNPVPAADRQVSWTTPEYDPQAVAASNRVNYLLAFTGGLETKAQGSNIRAYNADGSQSRLCDTTLSCLDAEFSRFTAQGQMDLCSRAKSAPCLESLEYKLSQGDYKKALYAFTVDPSPTASDVQRAKANGALNVQLKSGWADGEVQGLPASASGPLVFDLPGAINSAGTSTYAIDSAFSLSGQKGLTGGSLSGFHASVIPVKDDPTSHCESIWYDTKIGSNSLTNGLGCADDQKAYFSSQSIGWASRFPENLTLRLTMRLPQSLGGWLQGRADSPNVNITSQPDGSNLVAIEAAPTTVPTTATPVAMYDPAKSNIAKLFGLTNPYWDQFRPQDGTAPGSIYTSGDAWTPARGGSSLIGEVAAEVGNKAKGSISVWEFKQLTSSGPCVSDASALQGLLTTNAMTYQPDLPAMSEGYLTYSVAGLHYDSSGSVFQGSYNFVMRDSVARCLYGFKNNAPISGTISVSSSEGQEYVANTSVTDDGTWLRLTAQGFTFSNPVIRVKLAETVSAEPKIAPTPPSTSKSAVRCVRGKITKTIRGTSPKCPTGFTKK